jgi:ActR/RegA family two-component response regulator
MAHVLLVDDNQSFLETWTFALRRDGHSVQGAGTLSSALAAISARVPDVAVVDWRLPDGEGLQVVRTFVRKRLRVTTALITGFWADEEYDDLAREARALGVAEIIRRGIDIDDGPDDVVRRLLAPSQARYSAAIEGSEDARESIASDLLSLLLPMLHRRFPRASSEIVLDAVVDAIVESLSKQAQRPGHILSPERRIYVAAQRNLLNLLRSERRRLEREAAVARDWPPVDVHDSSLHPLLETVIEREPDVDVQHALVEWLKGDHGLDPWLRVRRFVGWPVADVRREAKRIKDAFLIRAKRARGRWPF